jgi:hypothetical protein
LEQKMTTLDFQEREAATDRTPSSEAGLFAGNRNFYERLQGQTRKPALERYGWVALPVAAVAIIGIVAATSTPHNSANDVAGPPGQASAQNVAAAAPATPAPAESDPTALARNDASTTTSPAAKATPDKVPVKSASVTAKSTAPVRVARRAPSSDAVAARPASAAPVESAPAAQLQAGPAPAATPAPAIQAPATVTEDAAPQVSAPAPAASAPSGDGSQATPSQGAPTDGAPAQ